MSMNKQTKTEFLALAVVVLIGSYVVLFWWLA